jgi:hypothetical protein
MSQIWVAFWFLSVHRWSDERLPKGPRFANESLDADTASGPVFSNWTTTCFANCSTCETLKNQ